MLRNKNNANNKIKKAKTKLNKDSKIRKYTCEDEILIDDTNEKFYKDSIKKDPNNRVKKMERSYFKKPVSANKSFDVNPYWNNILIM